MYELCSWAASYYHHALGEVLVNALPTALRKGKPAEVKAKKSIEGVEILQYCLN